MPIHDIVLTSGTSDITIPQLGLGVWRVPDGEVDSTVLTALEAGYRHVDTAKAYGNESGVGRALDKTDVPRDEIFVTTKVWPTEFGPQETVESFNASVDRLGLETLDLFLLHWPFPQQDRFVVAWQALQALRDAGRVRAIGVCNFHRDHLQRLFDETGEWPAINQIELHPYLQQREMVEFNAEHGIVTEAWSPLASGQQVLDDPAIGAIASRLGATPAQVILAWHLAQGFVVLPKSVTPSRIAENLAAAEVTLTPADLAEIAALDRGFRTGPNPDEYHG
ncbi:oxidoreductase [Knoellia sinensis KCTC 19936]|uniref:Oxidoreductase n=1 Tax=Knoellia sinensis KCTC 19936 TaxID=1385520 RepID=A0A0A0J463_9MICO|nr:aldo/keto reductase [Knoellia sinensis]KGN30411.1 oxidoreductase [Knoellia sinensis KCTC 19936]